ncbi:YdcF family protein [Sodalinema gerasimenkoae]|uniref:YdcF family protein n=1 Tax=Sodalinema gerasimenkoae TaxID=2862348 RepID=UPI001359BD86|nr:YdcF family protein [Sodalinema gerasimenkoae]
MQLGCRYSQPRQRVRSSRLKLGLRLLTLLTLLGLGWGGFRLYLRWTRVPQAVLVLGGSPDREVFAADFARTHPELTVWVSGGSNPEYAEWVFAEAGIPRQRFYLNYDAVDTVTNFTTLVDKLRSQEIRSIYLITSDYHMRRASAIGEIVLGSRDISFRPVAIPSELAPEPIDKSIRDGVRALVWLATGYTGSTLRDRFSPRLSLSPQPIYSETQPSLGTLNSWSE